MTIADPEEPGKAGIGRIPADIVLVGVLLLCTTLAFGLGILAGKDMARSADKEGFWVEQLPEEGGGGPAAVLEAVEPAQVQAEEPEVRTYVASKTGTRYYLPACGTAKRIKEENKVWFGTKAEAEAAGYAPAANCPGL